MDRKILVTLTIIFLIILGSVLYANLNKVVAPDPETNPTPTTTSQEQSVKIYLVALEDNGQKGEKIGCNDSLIAVEENIANASLRTVMERSLGIKEENYQGFYNALYQSELSVDQIISENNVSKIYLVGKLMQGGVCDSPRIENQLMKTAQEATDQEVQIYINGEVLSDALRQQ